MALLTQPLELAYEKSIYHASLTAKDEELRRLRVRIFFLKDQNDELQSQTSEDDYRMEDLETSAHEMQTQVKVLEMQSQKLRIDLGAKAREAEKLKVELDSLQGISVDSAKLLAEKLALSRELVSLKPEVEHLRSEATRHHGLLAEKMSLQRQLGAAEVELETERRALQRVLAKEASKQAEDGKLESQLEKLQAELTRERSERQKLERELHGASANLESRNAILDSRLDAFRSKLRMTKEQLKETQSELQRSRSTAAVHLEGDKEPAVRGSKKRTIAQLDTEATLGTPGLAPKAKRAKRGSTLLGDKSTFSITPYLNRTASVARESPEENQASISTQKDAKMNVNKGAGDDDPEAQSPSGKPVRSKKNEVSKGKMLSNKAPIPTAIATTGLNSSRALARKSKASSVLENVIEENNDDSPAQLEAESAGVPLAVGKKQEKDSSSIMNDELTFAMKKQKMLGGRISKTLFHGDDMEVRVGCDRGFKEASKAFASLRKNKIIKLKSGVESGTIDSTTGIGTFSPLKKDRRL